MNVAEDNPLIRSSLTTSCSHGDSHWADQWGPSVKTGPEDTHSSPNGLLLSNLS
jgi:hypothetical protein